MLSPLITVVLPTYNNQSTIGRALASILLQDNCDFELLIVNDGSTDETAKFIDKFAVYDRRVRPFHLDHNLGEGGARNFGIQQARGDYIAAQDGDDISLPHRLARQCAFLKGTPTVYGVATSAYSFSSQDGNLNLVVTPTSPSEIKNQLLAGRMSVIGASLMLMRDALLDCGGYRNIITPDFDLARRFVKKYSLGAITEPLYAYRPVMDTKYSIRYRAFFWLLLSYLRQEKNIISRVFLQQLFGAAAIGFFPQSYQLIKRLGLRSQPKFVVPPSWYLDWLVRLNSLEQKVMCA